MGEKTEWTIKEANDGWYIWDDVGPFDGPFNFLSGALDYARYLLSKKGIAESELDKHIVVVGDIKSMPPERTRVIFRKRKQ